MRTLAIQTKMVERVITDGLIAMVPKFDMAKFLKMLPCDDAFLYETDYHLLKLILFSSKRKDEIAEDVFELLASFGDFLAFKQEVLAHKQVRQHRTP